MKTIYEHAEEQIRKIEAELKRLKVWSPHTIASEKFTDMGAFGMNTMAFTEWLQFVLIPSVHSIIESNDDFPSEGSYVADYAYREFDGMEDIYGNLCELLKEFDELFNGASGAEQSLPK